MKLLLVRLDKIGDLVSTLPVDEVFHDLRLSSGESVEVDWVIAKGLSFLPENSDPPRKAYEVPLDSHLGPREFRRLLADLRPDAILFFYAPAWAYFEAWKQGIRWRIGRYSQWFSFLFLTSGKRQSRSQSEKHEADYNLELALRARSLLSPLQARPLSSTPQLKLKAPLLRQVFDRLLLRPKEYIVIHPGMAGSAFNWPAPHYEDLIRKILTHLPQQKVVITGTDMDRAWTTPLLAAFQSESRVISAVNDLNLRELLFLLQNARAVVVPSTGVAHLAASLGTRTLALYSPLRAHSSRRWGPRGPRVQIFEPESSRVPDSAECMRAISSEDVLQALLKEEP